LVILAFFLVFTLDRLGYYLMGDITLAPVLSVLCLAGLTFYLSPKQIMVWTLGFVLISFLLLTFWRYSFVPGGPYVAPDQKTGFSLARGGVRSATVLLAGGLCALLGLQRERLQAAVAETVAVMTALPSGVLISNSSGLISFANEKVAQILGAKVEDLIGSSFFSLLTSPEGNTIEKYSILAEVPGDKIERLILHLRKNPSVALRARLFCLQSASGKLVATVFDELPKES
jgi:PAS domain-containing protein